MKKVYMVLYGLIWFMYVACLSLYMRLVSPVGVYCFSYVLTHLCLMFFVRTLVATIFCLFLCFIFILSCLFYLIFFYLFILLNIEFCSLLSGRNIGAFLFDANAHFRAVGAHARPVGGLLDQ